MLCASVLPSFLPLRLTTTFSISSLCLLSSSPSIFKLQYLTHNTNYSSFDFFTSLSLSFSLCVHKSHNSTRPKGSSVENSVVGPRRYLIGGNWKCNGTTASNAELISTFNDAGPIPSNVDVAICAPYIYISQVASSLRDDIAVGAQDCAINSDMGAYTGEICASQLKDVGVTWVIVGHSERRQGFGDMTPGEPETHCATKCKVAIDAGLNVMFAIGEQKEERENGTTMEVCAKQLEPLAKLLSGDDWNKVAIGMFDTDYCVLLLSVCMSVCH